MGAGFPDSELEGSLKWAPEDHITQLRVISAKMLMTENRIRECAFKGEAPEEIDTFWFGEGSSSPFPGAATIAQESPTAFSSYCSKPKFF